MEPPHHDEELLQCTQFYLFRKNRCQCRRGISDRAKIGVSMDIRRRVVEETERILGYRLRLTFQGKMAVELRFKSKQKNIYPKIFLLHLNKTKKKLKQLPSVPVLEGDVLHQQNWMEIESTTLLNVYPVTSGITSCNDMAKSSTNLVVFGGLVIALLLLTVLYAT